ncbi:MAG: DUF488 family protein [Candidatus Moraniibacteriota bacterium]
MLPEVHTVSLFTPIEIDTGRIRISIISRPTLDDGKTPDERIIQGITHHEWLNDFAPPLKLIGAYKRKELSWKEYERKYLDFLRSSLMKRKVATLALRCLQEKITLACIEEKADFCHRRLLAEELQRRQPHLVIIHTQPWRKNMGETPSAFWTNERAPEKKLEKGPFNYINTETTFQATSQQTNSSSPISDSFAEELGLKPKD